MPRKLIFVLFMGLASAELLVGLEESQWAEKKGSHFVVYQREESNFGDEVLRRAEEAYRDIIDYFGSLPQSGFWSWDNRCKIYLYGSRSEYMAATRQPNWSSGFADINHRAIVSYDSAPDFLDSVLPHEIAHLIFREFVTAGNARVPRWLDEGFAIAQEERMRVSLDETVRRAVREDATIPVRDLSAIGSWQTRSAEQAKLFYAQAQSLTRFLLDQGDPSHFINFCRSLRDGVDLENALRSNYYQDFSDLEDFEEDWKKYVSNS